MDEVAAMARSSEAAQAPDTVGLLQPYRLGTLNLSIRIVVAPPTRSQARQAIRLLAGGRTARISGSEVSEKLSARSEEYCNDNLPITFRQDLRDEIDAANDLRLSVEPRLWGR